MGTTVEIEEGAAPTGAGQPKLSELPMGTQMLVHGSAAVDLAARTALASALMIPGSLGVLRTSRKQTRRDLAFYTDLAGARDASLTFPAPAGLPWVDALDAPPFSFKPDDGSVSMLRFESPYEAVNPSLREAYGRFAENKIAWAQHWRHDDGPRPTIAVIHGFGASPFWLNSRFFSLPWFYRLGYDVLMYLLPFHGVRRAAVVPFNGWGLFAYGIGHMVEAILHGVHDFRLFLDHLETEGVEQVALTGISLGGLTSALVASVDPRPTVVIPNVPVVRMGGLIREWFPASVLANVGSLVFRVDRDEVDEALEITSPLNYQPQIPFERRMIVGGLGDRFAPPEQSRLLWEHWERPRLHWFPGNHLLHTKQGVYLKEMRSFMQEAGMGGGGDARDGS